MIAMNHNQIFLSFLDCEFRNIEGTPAGATYFLRNSAKSIGLCMSFVRIRKLTWFEFPLPYISKFCMGEGSETGLTKKSKNTVGNKPIISSTLKLLVVIIIPYIISCWELVCFQEHLILLLLWQAGSFCLIITSWELPCHPAGIILL